MKYIYSLILFLVSLSLTTGQDVSFKFFDGYTGKAIQVDRLVIQSNTEKISFDKKELKVGNKFNKKVSAGDYEIGIQAKDFKPMTSRFSLLNNNNLRRAFYLKNLNPPQNISPEYIRSLHKKDGGVIVGYIVDENGMAIPNVAIQSQDGEYTTTDDSGYFQIFLKIKDLAKAYDIKRLQITSPTYKMDIRNKIVIHPNSDHIYKITLEKGEGKNINSMSSLIIENDNIIGKIEDQGKPIQEDHSSASVALKMADCSIPNSIDVGYSNINDPDTDCVNNCPFSITVDFELYVAEVLDNEWLAQWDALPNADEAFQAAAIAIRSFASWRRVVAPRTNPNYHITNNTNDQAYVPGYNSWSLENAQATEGIVVKSKFTGQFISTNYAAETNNYPTNSSNFPCGNGFVINSVFPNECISDPVTKDHPFNGHGWNMGQWGSIRWASGINLNQTIGVNSGPNHNHGIKTWEEILVQYYPSHELCISDPGVVCPPILQITDPVASIDHRASQKIIATSTVSNGVNAEFLSPSIELLPGFEGVLGSVLDAKFGGCQ